MIKTPPIGLNNLELIIFDIDNTLAYPSPYNNTKREDMFSADFGVKLLATPIAPWVIKNPSIFSMKTRVCYITGRHAIWKGITSLWLMAGNFKGGEQVFLDFENWEQYKRTKLDAVAKRIGDKKRVLIVEDNKEILDLVKAAHPEVFCIYIKNGDVEAIY